MPEEIKPDYVGLDIGQEWLDSCVDGRSVERSANSPVGRSKLIEQLKQLPHPRVICEASGGYEKAIVAELLAAGIEVCVVQPGRVRAYAYAEGLLAKTDAIDARLLWRYGEKIEPRLAVPSDPLLVTLRELLEHRRALTTQVSEVECRLTLAGATLVKLLGRQRTFLRKEIEKVEKMIRDHISNDPDLRYKSQRLQEITGVGPVLASTILAYVPELGKVQSATISALIGVAPYSDDSGKTSGPRHIRGGRAQVRHVLYMAAVCASHTNRILTAFYERLRAHGKPKKVCLTAVMRKLACLMNHLLQNPNFVLAD